jgi:hypothetical protein
MKTEEQQDLKTNELGRIIQAAGHRMEEYSSTIVIAICAILLAAAAYTWWSRSVSSATVNAWSLLESAKSIDDYGVIIDKYKTTLAGQWATLKQSEMYLQSGIAVMFSNRELANSDLKRCITGFEELVAQKKLDPVIRERALWGKAMALEVTSDGDTAKALDAYKQLLNEFPETIYKSLAEQHVKELKAGGSSDFYAWFAKQNPKPSESRPKDGMLPFDDSSTDPSDFRPNPPKGDSPGDEKNEAPALSTTPEKPVVPGSGKEDESKPKPSDDATPKPESAESKDTEPKN